MNTFLELIERAKEEHGQGITPLEPAFTMIDNSLCFWYNDKNGSTHIKMVEIMDKDFQKQIKMLNLYRYWLSIMYKREVSIEEACKRWVKVGHAENYKHI